MEHFRKIIKTTLILFCSAVLLGCNTSSTEAKEGVLLLEPNEFDQRLVLEKNPQIIDVRTPNEFSEGSIIHAVNFNILDGTLKKNISKLDSNKTVYVFCQKGGRSAKAVELLKESGFKSVIELKGGMDAWYKSDPVN